MAAGSLAMPAVLVVVALLACATARVAVVAGGCVGAICAMGACKELQLTIPFANITGYECECYPGWSWPNITFPYPLPPHLFLPCAVPTSCSYNDCGSEGTCVREGGLQFRCQCNPGATNVKGNPSMPCVKNCVIDDKGCPVSSPTTPPPPPSPSSSTAPPGNANGAPSSNKGSLSLKNRLRLSLLLASLAALHAVIV